MSDDVVKANPRFRFWTIVGLVLVLLIGVAAHLWVVPMAETYWRSMPAQQALRSMQWCLTLIFLPCAAIGYYQVRLASRIRSSEQFPPPGMAVIKDTVVLRGARAVRQANVFTGFGVVLIVIAIFGGYYVPWLMLHRLLE